jgi:FkbM family methyltransferase
MHTAIKNLVRTGVRRLGFDIVRFTPPVQQAQGGGLHRSEGREAARQIAIGGKTFRIESDDEYLQKLGSEFEPATVQLFDALVSKEDYVLDVGANIGCTALALGERAFKVVAFEPAPSTFEFLRRNVSHSGLTNVQLVNSALGSAPGEAQITFSASNRSGAFVSSHTSVSRDHVHEKIVVRRLDEVMPTLDVPRVDFIKIDVEGFEQSVLTGGAQTIARFRPVVMLELNHWCLNAFQRTSVPDFLDFLRSVFPVLLAVERERYANLHDQDDSYMVMYRHINHWEFPAIVGCFDADRLKTFYRTFRPAGA